MDSRRDFLKKAALLTAGFSGMLPPSIQRAFSINPEDGSTYLDAEHVVILMQENRSFDHVYGCLQGVRGFNDPRVIRLPDKNTVWLQTNAEGETYAPFRLNIKDTKSTWMGSLPHGWTDQVDARNDGKYDQWLQVKRSGNKEYSKMPLTLGYYNREDMPFYYSLADAFTICDQNFCSSLTGTTPNRLFLWTGTIRETQQADSVARVRNEELDYHVPASWKTFPERLEENDISWSIYQNEISAGVGFEGEEDSWLGNFTDNPIEWFTQYHVRYLPAYIKFLPRKIELLTEEVKQQKRQIETVSGKDLEHAKTRLIERERQLRMAMEQAKEYTPENFEKLPEQEKRIHKKAFTTNVNDPFYHQLTSLKYRDGKDARTMKIPKGDVLRQFREDVKTGSLPMVSWLVAPENFSDHPGAPWYGAWYVSEVMDILTKRPEVWKKTIFILTYDENDGYFDHVPPFLPPDPRRMGSGKVSKGIDTTLEFVLLEQDLLRKPVEQARGSAIGLGYRVPLVIASPWSRGGAVCSQVFDHTSVLQFLEKFVSQKTGKKIEETNISSWRRAVCGDLTSAFHRYNGEKIALPAFPEKDASLMAVHKSKFKDLPRGYRALTGTEIDAFNRDASPLRPKQESGVRPARPLPYQLYVDGRLSDDRKSFGLQFSAGKEFFGPRASGSPFQVYAPGRANKTWQYAVKAGDRITDLYPLDEFDRSYYRLSVYGPNGFYREFLGDPNDPLLEVACEYERDTRGQPSGNLELHFQNKSDVKYTIVLHDYAYKTSDQRVELAGKERRSVVRELTTSFGWYDFGIKVGGSDLFQARYAGHVETGNEGTTDPAMA